MKSLKLENFQQTVNLRQSLWKEFSERFSVIQEEHRCVCVCVCVLCACARARVYVCVCACVLCACARVCVVCVCARVVLGHIDNCLLYYLSQTNNDGKRRIDGEHV